MAELRKAMVVRTSVLEPIVAILKEEVSMNERKDSNLDLSL